MIPKLKRPFANRLAPGLLALGLVLFLLLPAGRAQEVRPPLSQPVIHLDTTGFDSLRHVLDYSGDVVKEIELNPAERKEKPSGFFQSLNTAAKVFFILFLAGLLGLFIWLISEQLSKPSDKKVPSVLDEARVDRLEEDLPQADLLTPLEQAIAAGDYNLAVRLLFLSYLKALIVKGLIEWRQDKTNGEYLAELRGKDHFESFSRLTLVYERVWYGKASISSEEFERIEQMFKNAGGQR